MPRLKESDTATKSRAVNANIRYFMEMHLTDKETLCRACGITSRTLTNRFSDPESWKLCELINIARVLNVGVVTLLSTPKS